MPLSTLAPPPPAQPVQLRDLTYGVSDNVVDGFVIGRLIGKVLDASDNASLAAFDASLFSGYPFMLSGDVVVGPFDREHCLSGVHSLYEYRLFGGNESALPTISWPLDNCAPSISDMRLPLVVGVPVYDDCGHEALRALSTRFVAWQQPDLVATPIYMSAYNNSLRALLDNLDTVDAHLLVVADANRFDRVFLSNTSTGGYVFPVRLTPHGHRVFLTAVMCFVLRPPFRVRKQNNRGTSIELANCGVCSVDVGRHDVAAQRDLFRRAARCVLFLFREYHVSVFPAAPIICCR